MFETMKKIFELKNKSDETQLVLNENDEQVEVKAWATFKTREKSLLLNYSHLFELVEEKEASEKVEKKPAEKKESAKKSK